MPFGRKSPLEALVITPASHLACKYNQFRARRREAQSRRVTERELSNLHNKIVSIFFLYWTETFILFKHQKSYNLLPSKIPLMHHSNLCEFPVQIKLLFNKKKSKKSKKCNTQLNSFFYFNFICLNPKGNAKIWK